MATILKIEKVLGCTPYPDGTDVVLLGDDGEQYAARFTPQSMQQLLRAFQIPPEAGTIHEMLSLTVTGQSAAIAPDRKALVLRTVEWGTIALEVPNSLISGIRES